MPSPKALTAAQELLRLGGMPDSPSLREFLSRDGREPVNDLAIEPEMVFECAMTGFFKAGAQGHAFSDANQIRERFGRTLAQNYPEAGSAFLKFAQAYWTLKLLNEEPDVRPDYSNAAAILSHIEQMIAGLFFPTPGPIKIDPKLREAKQREMLIKSGAPIDIEDFISPNPILIRDRQGALPRSRCLIATAAYGGEDVDEVRFLRVFRDQVLASRPLGRKLIWCYGHTAPYPARALLRVKPLRWLVRRLLDTTVRILKRHTTLSAADGPPASRTLAPRKNSPLR